MLSASSAASVVLVALAVVLVTSHAYQMGGSFPSLAEDRLFSHSSADLFSDRLQPEENDSSAASEEASVLDLSQQHSSPLVKRRKGPTLSVVNPLEILRQRLMLDLARRRIHENQQQIEANKEYLENIGKRASYQP